MRTTLALSIAGLALTLASPCLCADAPGDAPKPAREVNGQRILVEADLAGLKWRSVGPANMGGRVAAIALSTTDPKTWYIGYGTSGLWKTTNRGVTYEPVFDTEVTSSIGSVAVVDAPSSWRGWDALDTEAKAKGKDPIAAEKRAEEGVARIVWVGTGEGNGRNSSSWGNGVYRSTDAGASFTPLGLAETHDIPMLAVDPRDPDVCYVAALGRLWGPNAERGIYKTADGGATWTKSLFIDDNTGACDVAINPSNPDEVFAAMYARRRTPWSFLSGGPEGGIYRSRDGGQTWTKLTNGLPPQTGRIGLSICRSDPKVIYATLESDEGGRIADEWNDRSRLGGVYKSTDGGDTWAQTSDFNPRAFYFSRILADPNNCDRVWLAGYAMHRSDDGGKTWISDPAKVAHVDNHAIVIDPNDSDHIMIGNDGGLYCSWDSGEKWDFHNTMAVGQFYNIAVDDSDPYRVGGGLQDNGSWIGPSGTITQDTGDFMGRAGAITNADWDFIYGGDGYRVQFDPTDRNIVYAEYQGGNLARIELDTGKWWNLRPAAKEGEPRLRFNWNSPFFISPHDPTVLYLGGNHVFRLTKRGDAWTQISPDLSHNRVEQVRSVGSDAETFGTVVSLAESPVRAGVLWAGTDDGRVHTTDDTGAVWREVTPAEVAGRYISYITASPHSDRRAYVCVDGHRTDSLETIALATDDGGATWRRIEGDLPAGSPIRVIIDDPANENVLYAGNERGAYVSIDRGGHWVRLGGESLPTVPVFDFAIQKRWHDLVAATHGRSVWILDDASAVARLTPEIMQKPMHVFAPRQAKPRYFKEYGYLWSDKMFIADNPPMGAIVQFWLRDFADADVKVSVKNSAGVEVWSGTSPGRAGLNRVVWDLQADPKKRIANPHGRPEFVPAGTYTVTVTSGDLSGSTDLLVEAPPE